MKWTKLLIAGVAAAVALWLADFVMHGLILGPTYTKHEIFTREQASPFLFLFVALFIALAAALLFAKTRPCWGAGVKGGVTFGFFVGLVLFFPNFYYSIVFEEFPYFLCWCWGGINVIEFLIVGAVLGLIYK